MSARHDRTREALSSGNYEQADEFRVIHIGRNGAFGTVYVVTQEVAYEDTATSFVRHVARERVDGGGVFLFSGDYMLTEAEARRAVA